MKLSVNAPCPCGSGNKYKKCCQVFHKGKIPSSALELMKSRYSAYVAKDVGYIMKTTHAMNSDYSLDKDSWGKEILGFCNHTEFKKLDIIDFVDGEEESFVEFRATIFIDGKDATFIERSKFKKVENRWLYHSATFN
jgi:SEC-C motif-containing protein